MKVQTVEPKRVSSNFIRCSYDNDVLVFCARKTATGVDKCYYEHFDGNAYSMRPLNYDSLKPISLALLESSAGRIIRRTEMRSVAIREEYEYDDQDRLSKVGLANFSLEKKLFGPSAWYRMNYDPAGLSAVGKEWIDQATQSPGLFLTWERPREDLNLKKIQKQLKQLLVSQLIDSLNNGDFKNDLWALILCINTAGEEILPPVIKVCKKPEKDFQEVNASEIWIIPDYEQDLAIQFSSDCIELCASLNELFKYKGSELPFAFLKRVAKDLEERLHLDVGPRTTVQTCDLGRTDRLKIKLVCK